MNETFHAEHFDPINIKTINSRRERYSNTSNPIYLKYYLTLKGKYSKKKYSGLISNSLQVMGQQNK